jgi:hypothetical protein
MFRNSKFAIPLSLFVLSACASQVPPDGLDEAPASDAIESAVYEQVDALAGETEITPPEHIGDVQEGAKDGYRNGDGFFMTVGEGVASLGDPTRPGLWVRAPFLKRDQKLEAHYKPTGMSVIVDATRTDGPMQMSLATFQALALKPTELPVIELRTP